MTLKLAPLRGDRDRGWTRDVSVDGSMYTVGVSPSGRYRIAFKPAGTYGSHWFGRVTEKATGRTLWDGRVEKSTGARRCLQLAGILPKACCGSKLPGHGGDKTCDAAVYARDEWHDVQCERHARADAEARACETLFRALEMLRPRCAAGYTGGRQCWQVVARDGDLCGICEREAWSPMRAFDRPENRVQIQPRMVGAVVGRLVEAMGRL